MAQIKKKKYYRVSFKLTSPLTVGSGENQTTDRDIALDSKGKPYIPGSAMAGLFRREVADSEKYFGELLEATNEGAAKDASKKKDGNALTESNVIVYDATIEEGTEFVTNRDMVALDEYKTAKPGSKFDFQILEPGVQFVTYLEQNIYEGDDEHVLDSALAKLVAGTLTVGAKTRRGYGHIQAKAGGIKTAVFCMGETSGSEDHIRSLEDWLEFDLYNKESECWEGWTLPEQASLDDTLRIKLHLKQKGGLSVRQYSTKPEAPDYVQMKLHGENSAAVIPGTTWAGAFRAQLKKLGLEKEELESFFGTKKEATGVRSRISFGESEIPNGNDVIYSRNAIDRFTGGTVDGALYTESIHYNGTTKLEIALESGKYKSAEKFCRALAAAIVDLHEGYLSVGGLTSVGRGLFSVTEIDINGWKMKVGSNKPEEMYQMISKEIWEVVKKWENK